MHKTVNYWRPLCGHEDRSVSLVVANTSLTDTRARKYHQNDQEYRHWQLQCNSWWPHIQAKGWIHSSWAQKNSRDGCGPLSHSECHRCPFPILGNTWVSLLGKSNTLILGQDPKVARTSHSAWQTAFNMWHGRGSIGTMKENSLTQILKPWPYSLASYCSWSQGWNRKRTRKS